MDKSKRQRGIGRGLTRGGASIGRNGGHASRSIEPIKKIDFSCLGARIKEERLRNRLTQEQLAEQVGVTTAFIGHIERAERSLSLETLVRISIALGVTIDYLTSDFVKPQSDDVFIEELQSLLADKTNQQKQAVLDVVRALLRHL